MLPVLEGVIRRRILVNFRADPAWFRPLVPAPLEVSTVGGEAIVGVCLIGLAQVRPKGLPAVTGLSSENMAHRIAVRFPDGGQWRDGVFSFRRDTDNRLMSLLGGRLFPGVHGHATFLIKEQPGGVSFHSRTADGSADVLLEANDASSWQATPAFPTFDEVSSFFRRGSCGFSCGLDRELEGMELRTLEWKMTPMVVRSCRVPFYESRWPVVFDSALIMRDVTHEWHER